jgi:hypothetical protein
MHGEKTHDKSLLLSSSYLVEKKTIETISVPCDRYTMKMEKVLGKQTGRGLYVRDALWDVVMLELSLGEELE